MDLKAPFVDSSNRMPFTANPKHHTHLRSSGAPSLQKSPPTCTVSLASVTADLTVSLDLPATINVPLSAPRSSCLSFPTDADASCGDLSPAHEARRPRARTSSLDPLRRAYPPKLRAVHGFIPKQPPFTPPSSAALSTSTSPRTTTAPDLRLASLLARSIATNLARLHANLNAIPEPSPSLSNLEQQDLLLCERLQALLALHGRGVRSGSPTPTGITPAACAPSVLLSGSEGVDMTYPLLSTVTPVPPAPLRFITTTTRARSSSRGCAGSSSAVLEMPVLVATLLLRRREGKGQTGADTRRVFVPRASKLRIAG
ncbi:hypothetical protein DFH08DRAFT_964273 [Mycena albidolilacea]|uniref:Uncharacterized protein n=1 Tax=Mycena albidolilacea TaxID=1033008 RepID=A0AAD6ZU74_9AGAR|nr:hypothetical protein DFH08DRAFT_964273 [Mycena albidolilacea]